MVKIFAVELDAYFSTQLSLLKYNEATSRQLPVTFVVCCQSLTERPMIERKVSRQLPVPLCIRNVIKRLLTISGSLLNKTLWSLINTLTVRLLPKTTLRTHSIYTVLGPVPQSTAPWNCKKLHATEIQTPLGPKDLSGVGIR